MRPLERDSVLNHDTIKHFWFSSMEEAALAFMEVYYPLTTRRGHEQEYGARIRYDENEGKFFIDYLVYSRMFGDDMDYLEIDIDLSELKGRQRTVAVIHTHHGEGRVNEIFTDPDDYDITRDHGIPHFLVTQHGNLLRMDPNPNDRYNVRIGDLIIDPLNNDPNWIRRGR